MTQSIWPWGKMYRRWPSSTCVQQLLVRAITEVMDCMLGNSILEVGIHATEGLTFAAAVACLTEGIAREMSIIIVVVLDTDTMVGCKGLECSFGC